MQKEFTENMNKLYQTMTKPMAEMAELNLNTLNNLTKNSNAFEDFTQSKRPEDLLSAQMKLMNTAYAELTKYTQKAMDIGMNALSEGGKIWNDLCRQSSFKATEFAKQGVGGGKREGRE